MVRPERRCGREKFVDVGFLYGPWCPAYGFGGLAFAVFLTELHDNLFFLFVGGTILSFVVTYTTGFVLERIFHRKWWDFSRKRFQFSGYVSLPWSVVWGLLGVLCIRFVNPFLRDVLKLLPHGVGKIILLVLGIIFIMDFVGTLVGILKVRSSVRKASLLYGVAENLQKTSDEMGGQTDGLCAAPYGAGLPETGVGGASASQTGAGARKRDAARSRRQASLRWAAAFINWYACFCWVPSWVISPETIFCYVTAGKLMSRSSVVYGPFSIVWGLGCALLTAVLYRYKDRSDSFIFCFGTVLGGAYEYHLQRLYGADIRYSVLGLQ